jgi:DNA-binding LacI/PurR family transcriptional regulator
MKSDIASGIYSPGSFLPNELELAEKYGYARNTVRPALAMLEDDKIIESLKGRGRRICTETRVKAKPPISFLLPCPDFISETFSNVSAQNTRRMLKGVSQIAFERDCCVEMVSVSPTNNQHDIDWRKLDLVNKNSMLVVFGDWYRDLFLLLLERGCRMAFIGSHLSKEDERLLNSSFRIITNAFGAAEAAVKYLFENGCRRIALFHHCVSEPHPVMGGYLSGIKKCGLGFTAWHEFQEEALQLQEIRIQLKSFYKKSGGFDSLVISPEVINLVPIHSNLYQSLGLSEDIKIIAPSDVSNYHNVTCMVFPYEEIGRTAARHLLSPDFSSGEQLINGRLIECKSISAFSRKEQLVPV